MFAIGRKLVYNVRGSALATRITGVIVPEHAGCRDRSWRKEITTGKTDYGIVQALLHL